MSTLLGKTLSNRYHIQEFLGRGGMAEVYKVWDSQRMTYLAMKVLLEDLALDKVFIRRFKREASNLDRLQHPNIVRFFGFEKDDSFAYMLIDYIEGMTLKHLIHDSSGTVDYNQIRLIMRAICSALNYAHNSGFVHCDIKPGNIMIDTNGHVLLTDFGIARMTDAATATMVGAGTPAYMAPEQVRGDDPIPQTDIYALGIVLYEMLTGGERPFTGEQAHITGSVSEKVRWEQMNLPPVSPREWNPNISSEVEAVVLKCLEKNPEKRHTSAVELYNALEKAMGDTGDEPSAIRELKSAVEKRQPDRLTSPEPASQPQPGRKIPTFVWIAGAVVVFILGWNLVSNDKPSIPSIASDIPSSLEILPMTYKAPTKENDVPLPISTNTQALMPSRIPTYSSKLSYKDGDMVINETDGSTLVYISEGCFQMGANKTESEFINDRETPRHEVCLDAYLIQQTEVTVRQFRRFVKDTNYRTVAESRGNAQVFLGDGWQTDGKANWKNPTGSFGSSVGNKYPAAQITRDDAVSYCEWAGMRLPTEAEWEHAARGPTNTLYPWGQDWPRNPGKYVNLCELSCPDVDKDHGFNDGYERSAPVASYQPNDYGLYDMAGNLWEWVADWYDSNYYKNSPRNNPTGPDSGSGGILRGGSWDYGQGSSRSTYRKSRDIGTPWESDGFRCAVSQGE